MFLQLEKIGENEISRLFPEVQCPRYVLFLSNKSTTHCILTLSFILGVFIHFIFSYILSLIGILQSSATHINRKTPTPFNFSGQPDVAGSKKLIFYSLQKCFHKHFLSQKHVKWKKQSSNAPAVGKKQLQQKLRGYQLEYKGH